VVVAEAQEIIEEAEMAAQVAALAVIVALMEEQVILHQ
jgi:hypothetical protein